MSRHKATPKNLKQVFARILEQAKNPDFARQFCLDLNQMLDSQCEEDFYGTECQCDPRGDQRD